MHEWPKNTYAPLPEVGGEWKGKHGYEKPYRRYHMKCSTATVNENQHPVLESVLVPHRHSQTFSKIARDVANAYAVVHTSHGDTW